MSGVKGKGLSIDFAGTTLKTPGSYSNVAIPRSIVNSTSPFEPLGSASTSDCFVTTNGVGDVFTSQACYVSASTLKL